MWLPQGGALKIENLQFTQYSIIMLLSSMLYLLLTAALQLTIIRLHVYMRSVQKIIPCSYDHIIYQLTSLQ